MINKYGKGSVTQIATVSKGPLKRDVLDIYLTAFSGVRNFENTSAMTVIFLWKMFKIECRFQKLRERSEKVFFSQIIISELAA